jgi:phospholipid/cholesterol/gamma-HCH transport system substrate-binding protein
MKTKIKNILVGAFVLVAIFALIGVIMFIKPTIGDGKQVLNVRFSDINNLHVGTRVLFAGRPVGEVVTLSEIHDAREEPTDELGRVYFYQLTLKIDSSVRVYNTDEISIQTSGLMGEKSIAITPKAPPKGVTPRLITAQPVYANSVDTFQNAVLEFSELATSMEETFHQISKWVKNHGEELATTVRAAGSALDEIDQAVATYNTSGTLGDIQRGLKAAYGTLNQVQNALEQLDEKQAFKNAGIVMQNIKSTSRNVDQITEEILQGKGTLGRLVLGEDLYLQMNAMMTKANGVMNDLNHYGILFHLNKEWQRTRLKKVTQLNALSSPQGFRTYFQNEVDDINASMSRLSMLVDKANDSPQRQGIFENGQFKQDFAELLRRSEELSNNLRLYNQYLSDKAGR